MTPQLSAEDTTSEPTLSVIIPVYNGTPYLPELIESLLAQQRVPDEVIFVDDGSTDSSAAMITKLGAGLVGLKVVRQDNQGQAIARNTGMRHATSRYLAFLDADDLVDPGRYVTLIGIAEDDRLDIAMCNAWNYHEGRRPDTLVYRDLPDSGVMTGEAWFQQRWLDRYLPHYCWMNIYRRAFIEEHGFAFPRAEPHEDVVWVTETLLAARRFRYIPKPLHRYRKKQTLALPPAPLTAGGAFRRHKVVESTLYNARALAEIAGREGLQPLTRKLIRRELVNGGCNVIRQIRRQLDPMQAAHYLRRIREERFFPLLWRNAAGPSQHWRLFRYHSLAYFLAAATFLRTALLGSREIRR